MAEIVVREQRKRQVPPGDARAGRLRARGTTNKLKNTFLKAHSTWNLPSGPYG